MTKNEFRKTIAEKRLGLSAEYRCNASAEISALVIASREFTEAECIFVYVSTDDEPDTQTIIEKALSMGKRVCVPRCRKKPFMDAVRIYSRRELTEGKYGIPEPPETAKKVKPEEIDLAIIPCVAASKNGKRIGHGAGYYDTFLEKCRAFKMCLCFEKLINEEIPTEPCDVLMDWVICDKER